MGDEYTPNDDDGQFERDICMTALMREYAGNFSTCRIERREDAVVITTYRDAINDRPAREIVVHVAVTITEAEG
jgi:hypothetical protein